MRESKVEVHSNKYVSCSECEPVTFGTILTLKCKLERDYRIKSLKWSIKSVITMI